VDRLAHLAAIWSWLPGFRAVAETESVHAAARKLRLSPSSLSRTVAQLEAAVGRPLFDRVGRAMRLTALGHALLAEVRTAMRAIDDAVATRERALAIAAAADLAEMLVIPVVVGWRRTRGELALRVHSDPELDAAGRLLRGELDVVVTTAPPRHRDLITVALSPVTVGLYVAGDRAAAARTAGLDAIAAAPRVTYRGCGIPLDETAQVAIEVGDVRDAVTIAAAGDLVVAIPDPLARALDVPLARVGPATPDPIALHAALRRALGTAHASDDLVAALAGAR
jgi:DNA-binding transcriptional LysR family regulator